MALFLLALASVALIVLVCALGIATPSLVTNWVGRVALLIGMAVLPLAVALGGLAAGVQESSKTRFCLSCHEMTSYGKTLFVDNTDALAAAHYQNRLIDRDTTCYRCHTNYALFGHVSAKLNGLKHVAVHYFGEIPDKIELYEPYPNSICLECHEDSRSYLESEGHEDELAGLAAGSTSCLDCHDIAHDRESVETNSYWQAE
ncbi:MAG: NapC/NirT family cytochrome c [Myxococcota bacterium]